MSKNILREKSLLFALRIVHAYRFLCERKQEYVLSKQLLRSGTSIGAMVRESEYAESQPDFVHKLSVALKEANETGYWLELLHSTEYIDSQTYDSIFADCDEIIKLLASSIKTVKSKITPK
ncbi:MAG: four helix bundle protein [Prevotellaceae bacterium]|jgi:four helix bundle protein|nr:four helix bundle protein [Prevotellaceae bacterium]